MSQWHAAPPAYTPESLEAHQGYNYNPPGFRAPPPPPPLPSRPTPIDVPGRNPPPRSSSRVYNELYGAEAGYQQEIDYGPSTSYRRPLPVVPGSLPKLPVVTPPELGPPGGYENDIGGRVDEHGQHSYDMAPPGHPPAPPQVQLVASPERLNANLPPTPSSSIRRRQRQSEQSFNSSLRSGGSSIRSTQTPASFNSNEPPPWVIPYQPDSHANTIAAPSNADISLPNLNPDPGYVVTGKAFNLYLNKGSQGMPPAYGRGEPVEGYVELKELKDLKDISEIEVTLQGELQVEYADHGQLAESKEVPLFTEHKKLYTSAYHRDPGVTNAFSFVFPQRCDASTTPLPPTWKLDRAGVHARVVYTIDAKVKRRGMFKRKEHLVANVEYYPRTAPPPMEESSRPKLRVLYIEENLPPMGRSGAERPMVPTPFTARISLQDPVIYTSGTSIPYTVTLSSPVHTSVPASLDIEVQLIKVTETFISRKREEVKKLLADGQNLERRDKLGAHRRTNTDGTEPQNGATVIIKGAIQAGSEGGEMSWKIENVVAVKYFLRFAVVPKKNMSDFPAFLEALPTFEHSEEVVLTTDRASTLMSDIQASLPAVGLSPARTMSLLSAANSPITAGGSSSTGNFGSYGSGGSGLAGSGRQDTARAGSLQGSRRIRSTAPTGNPIL